jgi:DICT domain-containing protein/signal transduction histidine kinase
MSRSTSVLTELLQFLPQWRSQMYFKASLTALSHAMEDQVLAEDDQPLVIASFQRERFYRQEAHRYRRIAQKTSQVYVLAAPESDFKHSSDVYETIAFQPEDSLAQEWHLVVIGRNYASCLICRERTHLVADGENGTIMDNNRRFEGIWTSDRHASQQAAHILLNHILDYRPELGEKIRRAQQDYLICELTGADHLPQDEPDPFVQRLVTYLQAGQYKLLKANRSLASKEHKERLINSVTASIRRSLDPEDILQVAVQKLGQGLGVCRCVVYRCHEADTSATIEHEFLNAAIVSLKGQKWPVKNNPLFREVLELRESLKIDDAIHDPRIPADSIQNLVRECSISSWLLVPIFYQSRLLGMLELHHCGPNPATWKSEDVALVDAVATQIGVALIQAEAYANLQDLNEQLAALDRTRSNLVAITGHELRTPLSTIQVCLESLASEPDMPAEMRHIMLDTALKDAERMRKLIQDFLTLSRLEGGRVNWNPEALSLSECVELAMSHVHARNLDTETPKIANLVPPNLPFVLADGEWLVELLSKLLDNACKFTTCEGTVSIEVTSGEQKNLEVTISDTGRGIEPNRLEKVFDRFYQEEGALRRSAGGTGLGLAICRQIVNGWGGEIWAKSEGKNHGSQFHFTIPIFKDDNHEIPKTSPPKKSPRRTANKRK